MAKEIILGSKSKIPIPFEVQREYIQFHDLNDSQELPESALLEETKKLFLKNTSLETKKKLLFLLAHNGKPKAFKLLKKYRKVASKQLKAWAELCLQECAGRLGAELLSQEETLVVLSGADGDGQRLRYFFIFTTVKSKTFKPTEKLAIKKSVKQVDLKLKCKTERVDFGNNYFVISVLIPMDIAAEEYFQEMYKTINSKKEILRYHYYCNNVLKPTLKDIAEYLKGLAI